MRKIFIILVNNNQQVSELITNFQIIAPDPLLKNYIERIFVIESSGRLPVNDLKLIVPNACAKLVIPFKNGLIGKTEQWESLTRENKIAFIGISDIPASVDYQKDEAAGNITVEFNPLGAYRFFDFRWDLVKNKIYDYSELSQKSTLELEEKLAHTPMIKEKLGIIQQYLISRLLKHKSDPVLDFCIEKITSSKGKISLRDLEKQTG